MEQRRMAWWPAVAGAAVAMALVLVGTIPAAAAPPPPQSPGAQLPAGTKAQADAAYGKLPLSFYQAPAAAGRPAQFAAGRLGAGISVGPTGVAVDLVPQGGANAPSGGLRPARRGATFGPGALASQLPRHGGHAGVVSASLVGANPGAPLQGASPLPGVVNLIQGRNRAGWQLGLPTYAGVEAAAVYPGVNVEYFGSQDGLEYDFVVAPGASTAPIAMRVTGDGTPAVPVGGNLQVHVGQGQVTQRQAIAYQGQGQARQPVPVSYVDEGGGRFGFQVGSYDHSRALVIDPLIDYSTYLGGSGYDAGRAIAIDGQGSAYVAGLTGSSNFPGAQNADPAPGNTHAFVSKLNPAGTALDYTTYLGGSGDDEALAIAVDGAGDTFVTGATDSPDFPLVNAAQSVYGGGADAFVARLDPTGSTLMYSNYLGGSNYDLGYGIAVDPSDNAYVTGVTDSANFPVVGGLGGAPAAGSHAFVTKVDSGGAIGYSTYLGGSGNDGASSIAVDWLGEAYVTGLTTSNNFPVAGGVQTALKGAANAFVTKLNAAGSGLVFSTYLGGSGYDEGLAITLDQSDDVFVAGFTTSTNFPTALAWHPRNAGGTDAFLTKLSAQGSSLRYSTYIGGSGTDIAYAVGVDWRGYAYVAGVTSSPNYPQVNSSATFGGSSNAFLTEVSPGGALVVYSTYLGGTGDDQALGEVVDAAGDVYLTGSTTSTDFPTLNPVQPQNAGATDSFVLKVPALVPEDTWPKYLYDSGNSSDDAAQLLLNTTTAPLLRPLWSVKTGNFVTVEPVVGNGYVYFGSWDGYERAVDPSGRVVWATFLGQTSNNVAGCQGGTVGVADIPVLSTLNGTPVLYIGGGDANLYALNALTGALIWKTSLGTPPGQFLWASPVVVGGSVYEGVGSFQECPQIPGQLVQLDAATGAEQNVLTIPPPGCQAAADLSTPAVDQSAGVLFISTGEAEPDDCATSDPFGQAVVELTISNLSPVSSWAIPEKQQITNDPDFITSPSFFTATVGGQPLQMLGLANKNGVYYAFNRANLAAGPVWQDTIGAAGADPTAGTGAPISTSAFDGSNIYVGSNTTTINGKTCGGSLRAINPANGAYIWQACYAQPVLGPVSLTQGMAVISAGQDVIVAATANGATLFDFHDTNLSGPPLNDNQVFWAGAAISQGVIYIGGNDDNLWAIGV